MVKSFFCTLLFLASCTIVVRADPPDAEDSAGQAAKHHAASVAKSANLVTGTMINAGSRQPVEFVAVTLKKPDGTVVQGTVTDSRGRFALEKVPPGDYVVTYGRVGGAIRATDPFKVDSRHRSLDLGVLNPADGSVHLEKFEVTARKESQLNTIDRKVYNVGSEIQSTTGSASDLLQNVPSIAVDIDGNVSLRGSDNVLILIDGHTSVLMGRNPGEALAQLPADAIDRIEVITNPSAKYKPDGTGGIINIALKRKHDSGLSGTVNVSAGNSGRRNTGLSLNYRPGSYNLFGSVSLRQDDRPRTAADIRTITDPVTGVVTHAEKRTVEDARPLAQLVRLGWDYAPNEHNQFGLSGIYNDRFFKRYATDHNLVTDVNGVVQSDYDRARYDPEAQRSEELSATYRHSFAEDGHELNLEFKSASTRENEPDHYTNTYRTPVQGPSYDEVLIQNLESSREAVIGYVRPSGDASKFEAGYDLTVEKRDLDYYNAYLDPVSDTWVKDLVKSNRFILDRTIHAFYATYAHSFATWALLAGVRPEIATTESHLITTGQNIPNNYNRIYPSLHLTRRLGEWSEWQLNYSHRVHRPDTEDLNPFPEYLDPFTLRAGNPHLQPEEIHSVETGYGYRQGDTSYTATAYYRYTYHGFTNFTTDLGNGVLLTTHENLAVNRASGLELTATTDLGRYVTLNFSSNTYFNTIDASNLGFTTNRSDVSWFAKAGITVRLAKDTQLQFNANYHSARLTPQGERRATHVGNLGLRHDLWKKKAAVILTVSDLFNSLKEEYIVNTPLLQEDVIRRRSARIIYLGLSYSFGTPAKKPKDDELKFDNSL
ncbi:MAG: TonB-dependent receptor domain-containing protein [Opitutales bacterium]